MIRDKARAEAIAMGETRYSNGKPCKYGHYSERYVNSHACVECMLRHHRLRCNPKVIWIAKAVSDAKIRARKASTPVPHAIDSKYIHSILPDRCPIFGTEFVFRGNKKVCSESATLDRLVPELGYVPGNVAVISMKANRIKNAYGSKDILKVGEWLKNRGL